jgi:UDP-N-acetylglucosamine--N-acetylmuramyl-(pentapeptide) pyrophosphoryl-undecaprenol N-acetylglucosamine transferase
MTERKIIISGGGTGGHVFPALSIAREIMKTHPGTNLLFVGAMGRMEMEKVPAAGYPIIGLPVEGFRRTLTLWNFVVLFKLLMCLFRASRILKRFRPHMVIGVGGYASGPILAMAAVKRIPFVIQEQNSYAGLTNRWISGRAKRIFVAYPDMEKYFPAEKIILAGNPVREELMNAQAERNEACTYFDVPPDRPVLFVLGGSLGAATLNLSVLHHLKFIEETGVHLLWQTGSLYAEQISKALAEKELPYVTRFDFIQRMDLAYILADVIISRAGAGTISELCCIGKPVILVPSPNVAEDHQTKNAMVLVNRKAALMMPDRDARALLIPEALRLIHDDGLKAELSENCSKMALTGSAMTIVEETFKLMTA